MGLDKTQVAAYKKIVTQLARSCKAILDRLWKEGKIPRDSLWSIRDLKQQIWRDYAANPDVTKVIKNFLSGKLSLGDIRPTDEYAQSLADMITPADDPELKKNLMNLSKTEPDSDLISEDLDSERQEGDEWKQLGGGWKMKTSRKSNKRKSRKSRKSASEPIDKARANWNTETGNAYVRQYFAKRYRIIREVLYQQLPQWKKDVVDTEPNDRISNELATLVWRTAEDFDEYQKLVMSLDEKPVSDKLRSSLIMLTDFV